MFPKRPMKKNGTEDGKRVKPTDISKNKIPEE